MSSFWNGYVLDDFLFEGFGTKTVTGFIGLFVALISAGVLFEALNLLKNKILQKFFNLRRELRIQSESQSQIVSQHEQSNLNGRNETNGMNDSAEAVSEDDDVNVNPRNSLINDELYYGISQLAAATQQRFTNCHGLLYLITSSILHAVYAFSGYTLMNAVMTFNVWVLVAVCLGMGIGSFVFRAGAITLPNNENDIEENNASAETYAQSTVNDKTDQDFDKDDDDEHLLARASPIDDKEFSDNGAPSHSSELISSKPHAINDNNKEQEGNKSNTRQVILVGAQVHCDYQQSV